MSEWKHVKLRIQGKDTINVVLSEVSGTVDEVVVTGYQRIRKTDMVGSTNTVKREDMFFDGTDR
ncbi:MAG: hypothetical protein V8R91_13375 [Butyricimonas faecihominis]